MKFFRKVWAIYGIVLFFLLWISLFPFYLLAFLFFPKRWLRYIIWFSHHIYTRLIFGLTLIRIKVKGKEKLTPKATYIIVSNHRTAIDFMVNAHAYPGVYKFLAKKELSKVPFFGFIVKRLCVLVDRTNAASRTGSIKYLTRTLAEGYSIFLYPEGTRNRSSEPLGSFQKGAFRIALETGTPIAVQTIVEIENVSATAKAFDLSPGTIRVVWSEPIETKHLEKNAVELNKLIAQVRAVMVENLAK